MSVCFNGKVFPQQRRFTRSRLLPSRVVRQTIYIERYTRIYIYIWRVVFWRTFSHDTIYLIIARFICNDESEFPVAKEIPRSACVAPCWGLLRNQRGWHSSFIIPNQSKNVMLTRVQVIKFVLWSEDAVIYLLSGYWIISN